MAAWMETPPNRDLGATHWAAHVLREIPSCDGEVETFYQRLVAVWAVRVFARMPWDVSKIYIVESSVFSGNVSFLQSFHGGRRDCCQLVVRMESK